jgi:cyclase
MIGLVDYGAGNLFSVWNATDRLGFESRIISSPTDFNGVDRIILPGVGHFGAAGERLRVSGVFDALRKWTAGGRPLLGIFLGMQLLFDRSDEDGGQNPGLGIFRGRVLELRGPRRLHMGWNTINPTTSGRFLSGGFYYFVHGFAPRAENAADILAESRFGESRFPAVVRRGAILGVQFHPEKSGPLGLDLLARWAEGRMDVPAAGATISPPSPSSPPAEINERFPLQVDKRFPTAFPGEPLVGGSKGVCPFGRRTDALSAAPRKRVDSLPAIRIIPCLDMDDGRVVKGVRFENLRDVGDPAELAHRYNAQRADELCFLDVGASWKSRKTLLEVVRRVSKEVFIPLTVGGGLRSVEDIREALAAGADKVSLCTAAVENPELLTAAAERFGRQCLVLSLDAKAKGDGWTVTTHGGRRDRNLDAASWAARAESLGAGEILLNSVDRDGTGTGYDLELLRQVRGAVRIPVIASGGGEDPAQAWAAVDQGEAEAVLLASGLHSGRRTVADYKNYFREKGARLR